MTIRQRGDPPDPGNDAAPLAGGAGVNGQNTSPHPTSPHSHELSNDLLNAALAYYARRWSIIPIRGDKKPAVRSWKPWQSRRAAAETLRRWFRNPNVQGLAVIFGPASGNLACRDFDTLESYGRWSREHPELAQTLPTVRTVRGFHVYFRAAGAGFRDFGDGELRNAGHYCILPPSVHPSGKRYRWVVGLPAGDVPIIDAAEVFGGNSDPKSALRLVLAGPDNPTPTTENDLSGPVCSCVSTLPPVGLDDPRVQAALERTIPQQKGQRNRCLFAFLRHLKALPGVAELPPAAIRPYVRAWHTRAKPKVGTPQWDATWADAVHGWPKIREPYGSGPLKDALARARVAADPKCAAAYEGEDARLLIRVIRELHRHRGGAGPLFLACRPIGDAVGIDKMTTSRLLRMLRTDGVIRLVKKGHTGRASDYFYVGD